MTQRVVGAWSLLAEEWGHVQNMGHFVPSGHEDPDGKTGPDPGYLNDHTMSGGTPRGQTDKRTLDTTEMLAACMPYRRIHAQC